MIKSSDKIILDKILSFLQEIKIEVVEQALDDTCLLPGLSIAENCVLLDISRLKYVGDILHEAGHLAVTAPEIRPLIGTDKINEDWPNDGDEIAAILWSYAALRHLNIDAEVVFHPEGYKDESDWIIEQFNCENYIGLPLLVWMGLCIHPDKLSEEYPIVYPKMLKWLR